ncbi:response regulator (CheY-like receiver, AAA-type ATPase and DNA-binding domain containing protein) [Candidatus Magnetoovum chiemensis]|nr:response regulator (CheY-like receiver, AAA-type ATPase and DNA-binding domain containing protein) [Candidatus Magnetoovum chiemensis]
MERIKVLLVDDEKDYVFTLSQRLQLRNYDVKAVFCVEDAFSSLLKNPPDVVLLDFKMPGMDGYEIFETMLSINPDVKIIVVSGQGLSDEAFEELKKRAFAFVMKPAEIKELDDIIKKAWSSIHVNK